MVSSLDPLAKQSFSFSLSKQRISALWSSRVAKHLPLLRRHSLTLLSQEPLASKSLPTNSRQITGALWPNSVLSHMPVSRRHTRMRESEEPDTTSAWSILGVFMRLRTLCKLNLAAIVLRRDPVDSSHTLILLSLEPLTRRLLSMLICMQFTLSECSLSNGLELEAASLKNSNYMILIELFELREIIKCLLLKKVDFLVLLSNFVDFYSPNKLFSNRYYSK